MQPHWPLSPMICPRSRPWRWLGTMLGTCPLSFVFRAQLLCARDNYYDYLKEKSKAFAYLDEALNRFVGIKPELEREASLR